MVDLQLAGARTLEHPEPVTISIADGQIEDVGPHDPSAAQVINLDGRWVIPGLWDQHAHVTQWAMASRRLPVGHAESAADAAAICAAAIVPGSDPLVANGFAEQRYPDEPTTTLLDEVCGDHPVALVSCDLHATWATTAAYEWFGWLEVPTGLLREDDAFEFQRRLNVVPMDTRDAWVAEAGRSAAVQGLVGIVDMEMVWNIDTWVRRMNAGFDTQRIRASIYPEWLDRAISLGLRTGDTFPAQPLLSVGPLKAIIDGSLNTMTAWCCEPYTGTAISGGLNFSPNEVRNLLTKARNHGISPAFHAIGDAAISFLLDLYAELDMAGRIEHAQFVADADLPRFAGIGACVSPQHAVDDRPVVDALWTGRTHQAYRFRDLLDAGAGVTFSSDAPVAALAPWAAIQAAVDRGMPGEDPWHPEQAFTIAEAVAASTDGQRVAPGAPADLAILDGDLETARGAALREMPVAATLLAGSWTHWAL